MGVFSDVAVSLTGPLGYVASKMTENKSTEHFEQESEQDMLINFIIWGFLAFVAIYFHYKCNNGIKEGVIPAFFCPICYIIFYLLTKKDCLSAKMV